ncbi:hypothetical protein GO491_10630 [Flavobacteriaceae bacterium Ap0902]|nr:hypothetical protein [Flavobacteriaceae bacterium Ap0902]
MLFSVSVFAGNGNESSEVVDGDLLVESNHLENIPYDVTNVIYLEMMPEKGEPVMFMCSVTLIVGSGTATGYDHGDTLEAACHAATDNAMNGGWSYNF